MEEAASSTLSDNFLEKLCKPEEDNQVKNILEDDNAAFVILLKTFEYLSVPDLLRASQVSKLWNFVGSHDLLWRKVSLKECILTDCNKLSKKIVKHRTQELDIEDAQLVIPKGSTLEILWTTMFNARKKMFALRRVKLGQCSPKSAFKIAKAAPQLKSFSCHLKKGKLNLAPLAKLENLEDLTLDGKDNPIILVNANSMQNLTNLRSLSMKRMKNFNNIVDFLPAGLVSLELIWFNTHFFDRFPRNSKVDLGLLSKLTNLKNLNLSEDNGLGIVLYDTKFLKSLNELTSLKLDRVYSEDLLENFPSGLRSLTFDWMTRYHEQVDLGFLSKLISLNMLTITDYKKQLSLINVSSFLCLKHLTSLTLKGIKNLNDVEYHLPSSLESLKIRDCRSLSSDFSFRAIPSLFNLKKLELEDGWGIFKTTDLLKTISLMPSVTHLSLINMEFKKGFQKPLSKCTKLESLHITPSSNADFETFSIHQRIINSVSSLKNSLKYFYLGFDVSFIDIVRQFNGGYDHRVKVSPWNESTKQEEISVAFISTCSCEEKPCKFLWHVIMIPIEVIEKEFFPQLLPTTHAQIRKTGGMARIYRGGIRGPFRGRNNSDGFFYREVGRMGQMEVELVHRGD